MQSTLDWLTGVAPAKPPAHLPLRGPVALDEAIVGRYRYPRHGQPSVQGTDGTVLETVGKRSQ
jgi:hypothetical protein